MKELLTGIQSHILERGKKYSQMVGLLRKVSGGYSALIPGSEVYHVRVEFAEKRIRRSFCDCMYARRSPGTVCKHAAALVFTISKRLSVLALPEAVLAERMPYISEDLLEECLEFSVENGMNAELAILMNERNRRRSGEDCFDDFSFDLSEVDDAFAQRDNTPEKLRKAMALYTD